MSKEYKNTFWTKEKCHEVALKYKTKNQFRKEYSVAYTLSVRKGWYNDITSHMLELIKPKKYWSLEKCKEEALKYSTRKEFEQGSMGAYSSSKINKWLNNVCSHMKPIGHKFKRLVYIYEFSDNHVYVGLSMDIDKRNNSHLNNIKSPIYKHIKQKGINPKLSYGEYIDAIDAQKLEEETIKKYKDNNWIILNKAKAGGLGGNTSIWTFKKCKEEASKYKSRTVFRNNSTSAYYYAIKNNWLDEICRHMIKLPNATHLFWTFEKCKEEALKYTTNKDFVKYSAGAYISSLRNGWINEIRSHMIK